MPGRKTEFMTTRAGVYVQHLAVIVIRDHAVKVRLCIFFLFNCYTTVYGGY